MSLSGRSRRENMMKLMAYADGELEGVERRDAELLLAREPEAVTFVEEVAGLGSILKEGHQDRHADLFASFDIADAVMTAAKTVEQDAPVAKVTSIAEIAAKRKAKEIPSSQARLLKIGVTVVTVMALAASVFVFVRGHKEEVPMAVNTPPPQATNVANVSSPEAESGPGVVIESAGKSVSVFYLPTANDLSTSAVIWVDESGEK